MNIIVSQFSFSFSRVIIEDLIDELKPNRIYNFSAYNGRITKKFQGTEILNFKYSDNYFGEYSDADFNCLLPLDESVISNFYFLESQVLEMMDRDFEYIIQDNSSDYSTYIQAKLSEQEDLSSIKQGKRLSQIPYRKRKEIYYRHLRYWYDFFSKNTVDYFISFYIPHTSQSFIAWNVAKYFGAKEIIGMKSFIPGNFVFVNDVNNSCSEIIGEYEKIKTSNQELIFDNDVFKDEIQRVLTNSKPWYMDKNQVLNLLESSEFSYELKENYMRGKLKSNNNLKFTFSYWKYFSLVLKFFITPFFRSKIYFSHIFLLDEFKSRVKNKFKLNALNQIKLFINQITVDKIEDEDFIYFPLHMQPEATTMPLGGLYANQLLAIEMLSNTIPQHWKIYIKEHPAQIVDFRGIDFYKKISELPNVKIIASNISTFELIEKCIAVSTITGVAGWEGVVLGKNCLLFGNSLFDKCPGVLKINTFDDCKKSIQIVESGLHKPKLENVKWYLKALENVSVDAADIPHTFELRGFKVKDHKERVLKAILNKL